jgi:hypothetical protein
MALFLLVAAIVALPSGASELLPELRRKADAARGGECAKLCLQAAQALVEQSSALFKQGDAAAAQAAIEDALSYAVRGVQESISARKHREQAEISIRELARHLSDLALTLDVEQRGPVDAGVNILDSLRLQLLASLFNLKPEPR